MTQLDQPTEFDAKADLLSLAVAPDKGTLFSGDLFGVVREFEIPSGKVTRTLEVKEFYKLDRIQDVGGVKCLLVSGDGKTLFAGGAEPKTGGFVQAVPLLVAFDLATGKAARMPTTGGLDPDGNYHPVWSPPGKDPKPDPPGAKAEARRFTRVRRLRYYSMRIRDGILEVAIPRE